MTTDTTDETIRTADVVLLAAGRVLLIKRGWAPYEGCWALPGGLADAGETSLTAAARELEEETGITVSTAGLRKVASYDAPGRDPAAGTSASPTRPPCPHPSRRWQETTPPPPAGGPWTRSPTSRSTTPKSSPTPRPADVKPAACAPPCCASPSLSRLPRLRPPPRSRPATSSSTPTGTASRAPPGPGPTARTATAKAAGGPAQAERPAPARPGLGHVSESCRSEALARTGPKVQRSLHPLSCPPDGSSSAAPPPGDHPKSPGAHTEARGNGWLGEVEGLQVGFDAAMAKLNSFKRAPTDGRPQLVDLGTPVFTDDTPPPHRGGRVVRADRGGVEGGEDGPLG